MATDSVVDTSAVESEVELHCIAHARLRDVHCPVSPDDLHCGCGSRPAARAFGAGGVRTGASGSKAAPLDQRPLLRRQRVDLRRLAVEALAWIISHTGRTLAHRSANRAGGQYRRSRRYARMNSRSGCSRLRVPTVCRPIRLPYAATIARPCVPLKARRVYCEVLMSVALDSAGFALMPEAARRRSTSQCSGTSPSHSTPLGLYFRIRRQSHDAASCASRSGLQMRSASWR